jgi:hypothetical protein
MEMATDSLFARISKWVFRIYVPIFAAQTAILPLQASAQTTIMLSPDERAVLEREDRINRIRQEVPRDNSTINYDFTRAQQDVAPIRFAPTMTADDQAVDGQRAQDLVNRHFPVLPTREQTNQDVKRAQSFSAQTFESNMRAYDDSVRANTERGPGNDKRISVHEMVPGYGDQSAQKLIDERGQAYDNPALIKEKAEYEQRRRLKRNGCLVTTFHPAQLTDPQRKFSSRAHRILSVTFYDYTKRPVPAQPGETEPCLIRGQASQCPKPDRDEYTITPSTYKGGAIKLSYPLFEADAAMWRDFVSDSHFVQYDYNPFSFRTGLNYFPYNVEVWYRTSAGEFRVNNAVLSYGSPSDRWNPTISFTPPLGTIEVIVRADVYYAQHDYYDPQQFGNVCPPQPPAACSQNASNGVPITWCPGTASANVALMFSPSSSPDIHTRTRADLSSLYGRSEPDVMNSGLGNKIIEAINTPSNPKYQSLVGACYRQPIQRSGDTIRRKEVGNEHTCVRKLLSAFEPDGCQGAQRAFGLSSLGNHVYLTLRGWERIKQEATIPQEPSPSPPTNPLPPGYCALPRGGSIANGQTITLYTSWYAPYGQSCSDISQNAICDNGVLKRLPLQAPALTLTATYPSCQAQAAPTYYNVVTDVWGTINLSDFPVMGTTQCPMRDSSRPDLGTFCDPPSGPYEGTFLQVIHTPFASDPKGHGVSGIGANVGTVSVSHYGRPSNNWAPSGTWSTPNVGAKEIQLYAQLQMVTVNQIDGCKKYFDIYRDGVCPRPPLTCVEERNPATVGTVTFGPGMPTDGFVDLLAPFVGEAGTAPDYAEPPDAQTGVGHPVINIPPGNHGLPVMCWRASGPPLLDCGRVDLNATIVTEDGLKFADMCPHATYRRDDGTTASLVNNCQPSPGRDSCPDSRDRGIVSGVCYNEVKVYFCPSTEERPNIEVGQDEFVEVCGGAMRCLGTQCHRPNLSGGAADSFAAVSGVMETINHMKYDMTCDEFDGEPTDPNQQCTIRVFKGKQLYCTYATGALDIAAELAAVEGSCCKEAMEKAGKSGGLNWMQYMQIYYLTKRAADTGLLYSVASSVGAEGLYNSVAGYFGDIKDAVTGAFNSAYEAAANFVSQNITTPLSSAVDNVASSFGVGGSATSVPADVAMDSIAKPEAMQNFFGSLENTIKQFKQMLLQKAFEFVNAISPQLAEKIFTTTVVDGNVVATGLNPAVEQALTAYAIFRFVVQMLVACNKTDYEWGVQNRWRLCAYAGNCCSKKVKFVGCVKRRNLYCCYKSIVARVIAEQIINKGLIPGRTWGQRRCSVDCSGFTIEEISSVDWSQIDLSEAIEAMIDAGILNPNNPSARYGVTDAGIDRIQASGFTALPEIDGRSPATKTIDAVVNNAQGVMELVNPLRGAKVCYDPSAPGKMPVAQPQGCPDE